MAAAVVSMTRIDFKNPSSHPLRLGASILKSADSRIYTSVRYNHKPRTRSSKEVSSSIKPLEADGVELILRDGSEEYGYTGRKEDGSDSFVLFSRGSGKDKELVLERLSHGHNFNLTSTPSHTNASKLAEKYQQLPLGDEDGDDLFGDDEDQEPADASNPFDYRNHLKPEVAKAKGGGGADTPHSSAATPRPAPRAATSKPFAQPKKPVVTSSPATQNKRKAQDPLKSNPKRVKAGTEPPAPDSAAKPKPRDVPSVRIDRKASIRRASFDDSGELILENETPVTDRPPRAPAAMALALSGQLGPGPISLRSAANSPASRVESPMPPRPDGIESPAEFELGGSSPATSTKSPRVPSPGDYSSNAGEDEEDADADVEDLELPSPRQRRQSVAQGGLAAGGGGGDEDYDMERELELALAQDDDAVVQPAAANESDEESEEE